jgi:cytochrome c nitrite reductase small subunit
MSTRSPLTRINPLYWRLGLTAVIGILVGLSLFTFYYARGTSYLSDDPQTCLNCHVMREQFQAWGHSSHRTVATCNDCHTPHGFPDKWVVKAINGWNHSVAFTLGNFHEPIRINQFNAQIVQQNCVECHQPFVSQMSAVHTDQNLTCTACHGNVGHGNRGRN